MLMRAILVLGIGLTVGAFATPQKDSVGKVKITETFRQEMLTRDMGSVKETETASKGKLTLNAEFPLEEREFSAFDAKTSLEIHVGGFERKVNFGDGTDYKPGAKSLKIPIKERWEKASRRIVGSLTLRFDKGKIPLKLDAQTPDAGVSAAAETAFKGGAGEAQIETPVTLLIIGKTFSWKTVLRGKVKEQHAGNSITYGSVQSVSLKN